MDLYRRQVFLPAQPLHRLRVNTKTVASFYHIKVIIKGYHNKLLLRQSNINTIQPPVSSFRELTHYNANKPDLLARFEIETIKNGIYFLEGDKILLTEIEHMC